ncbi:hypothetical protein [Marinomonas pollencensis]|uniref:DoxX-like protein n=1 Tax=Marinomonas pollencensis TaxID=491954 RepID=A0A3E0DT08_9GAMM|nr:hypothetical protein [Marinomonas pollencensis]REG86536.1 hypothetical protein DFP81_101101 [Marinomonas pollencensis]
MKKLFSNLLNVCSAIFMLKFGLPKLNSYDVSVKAFKQFSEVLPVDATVYMYFVGGLEVFIALMMVCIIFIQETAKKAIATYVSYLVLTGTLVVALLHEFFVRPAPIAALVVYSTVFLCISAIQFALYFKSLPKPFASQTR